MAVKICMINNKKVTHITTAQVDLWRFSKKMGDLFKDFIEFYT